MAESGSSDCSSQKSLISELLKTQLNKGDTWYLIDVKWFKQWKKYVGYDSWDTSQVGEETANPGPIDNSALYKDDESNQLKDHLIDELDYVLVPDAAWEKLLEWYHIVEGQEPIARKVIEQGMFVKHCKVEVYLMELKLCQNQDLDTVETQQFSRADTIEHIEHEMRQLFSIGDNREVRLWNKYMSNTYEHLNKPSNTVQDAGLYQNQVIVIEQMNEDGTWPRQSKVTASTTQSNGSDADNYVSNPTSTRSSLNQTSSRSYYYDDMHRQGSDPGLCGLSNLGNTCFMNSAIQCMSNVKALTEYFLNGTWKEELNKTNPLGMRGEIATNYAELMKQMWSGDHSYTVPRNFKVAVGRFAPQFSGYQQQDSQELMSFLLDGLHEDLNRIKNKPYVELHDADGRPDKEVADEAWSNYLKRNDSIITDIFHGLLKSTLVCPECEKISVTFDPFCYLSLPLPIKKERQQEVIFVPNDPAVKPTKYKLTVPKVGIVQDVVHALTSHVNISCDKLLVAEVEHCRFSKIFDMNDQLLGYNSSDIYCFEMPVNPVKTTDSIIVPVYFRQKKLQTYHYSSGGTELFGVPTFITIPRKGCTAEHLINILLKKMARYVTVPDDNNHWWKPAAQVIKSPDLANGDAKMGSDSQDESSDVEQSEEDQSGKHTTDEGTDGDGKDTVEENGAVHNGSSRQMNWSSNSGGPSRTDSSDDENNDSEGMDSDHHNKRLPLFTMHFVNSFGNHEIENIQDNGKPINFNNKSYLALHWNKKAKELFYDKDKAHEYVEDQSCHARPQPKKQTIELHECLKLFTTKETLGERDEWHCPQCKKHQRATKKFDLWSLPKVLVVHLKRFSYSRYWRDKLDSIVEYPTKGLDMSPYLINTEHGKAVYNLIGVSNHYGGMGGGHYTAYAKNKNNKWYNFDDSSVSSVNEKDVVTKAGYVLVYELESSSQKQAPATVSAPPQEGNQLSNGEMDEDSDSDTQMDVN